MRISCGEDPGSLCSAESEPSGMLILVGTSWNGWCTACAALPTRSAQASGRLIVMVVVCASRGLALAKGFIGPMIAAPNPVVAMGRRTEPAVSGACRARSPSGSPVCYGVRGTGSGPAQIAPHRPPHPAVHHRWWRRRPFGGLLWLLIRGSRRSLLPPAHSVRPAPPGRSAALCSHRSGRSRSGRC